MPELPEVFKASEEQTMEDGLKAIPPGWYPAQIIKSEMKEANSGNGKYLKLTFSILEGDFAKRNLWANLNLIHTNETTVSIAKRELASICQALNLDVVSDSEEMHGTPLNIKVAIRPATANWPEGNDIKAYKNIEDVPDDGTDESNPFD